MGGDHLWDAIGAIGQMLGSVAVCVMLGYLAVQVQHARNETRRAISSNRADALRQLWTTRATDERLRDVRVKAEQSLGSMAISPGFVETMMALGLTRGEAVALACEEAAWWNALWPAIEQMDELSTGQRMEHELGIRNGYGGSGVRAIWYRGVKAYLNSDAVRYIDNLLAQPG
jgi:hypothetical protein